MRQIGQRGDDPRRQLRIASFAALSTPENRAGADEVDIPPLELDGFGHACASADQKDQH